MTVDEAIAVLLRVRDQGHGSLPVVYCDNARVVDVSDATVIRIVGRDVVELSG